ncbi:hypothetical protein AMATHDRAFT_135907 [Amanita thiersii Skay4041]|uniref:U2 small nuclear ribonucleoprotein A' n=1 Tax=Amanita thiersii Skay4041 TaxID=703135 RepID=A0A2A9NXM8_9AGAR|nr:hypothetical protein AMATHDRAFT_135907 [Amanita thiersii Skay4041]
MSLPPIGTRISLAGHHGTVRYAGPVHGTDGIWLGVEWDDPSRGKHDGVKDGKQYFLCTVPGTGSFIRPSAKIFFGKSFLDALFSKYIEAPHGPDSQEKVVLGSSNGVIQVEAVRLDKIRSKLADFGNLREVGLDKEYVSKADPPGTILKACPNICGLDLSGSLLPSWDSVALVTSELSSLQRLALNRTRLLPPADFILMSKAFSKLLELQLNCTLTTWPDMVTVISMMPSLQLVEMGHNRLSRLPGTDKLVHNASIQVFNLDSNLCNNWTNLVQSFRHYPSYVLYSTFRGLLLASNGIESIPMPADTDQPLFAIKHLALSSNHIRTWRDIDALPFWCPNLESLTLVDNPLSIVMESSFRPLVIAKIASLKLLDGSLISDKERDDSELFYLSYIDRDRSRTQQMLMQEHPRWQDLCRKHGRPSTAPKTKEVAGKLSNHLISLAIYPASIFPGSNFSYDSATCISLSTLPSMKLRNLRQKICKVIKGRVTNDTVLLWRKMQDGNLANLDHLHDAQDLTWHGLENGSLIICTINDE